MPVALDRESEQANDQSERSIIIPVLYFIALLSALIQGLDSHSPPVDKTASNLMSIGH